MRLFVTGCESFVGRAFAAACDAAGIDCVGIDAGPVSRAGDRRLDIRSPDVAAAMPERVDAVVHLAALSRDADCVGHLQETFDVNVMGTLNVMRAAERQRARQFIFASTEWVYDSFDPAVDKTEDVVIDPRNLVSEYALSKLVGEGVLRQQFLRGFCDTAILRLGIIYGPRPGNWSAVESLADAVRSGREVSVGALGTARRFIHVADVVRGILRAVGLTGLHVINLQGPRLVTLGEIIETAGRVFNRAPRVVVGTSAPSIRNVSNERSRTLLDWQPEIDLEAGLRSLNWR